MRFSLTAASVAALGISFAFASAATAQDVGQQPAPDTAKTDAPAAEQLRSEGGNEVIIVTARRRSEQLQSTPVAVTPFDQRKLDDRQISTFGDLQFNVPNLTFTKTNFSGSSISIRAIGTTVTTSSGDSGVAIHVNEAPIVFANIFSTELYDVQAFEVLRGPQGTLFGRNATGGTVNLVTSRPVNDFTGYIEARVGDYKDRMFRGALNVPITDNFWVRGAFIDLSRDGYTKNVYNGERIDGRDQWSARLSLRYSPTESTDINLMYQRFKEDSNRSRVYKQMCHKDPDGVYGCLPDRLDFDTVHTGASRSHLQAAALGLLPWTRNTPSDILAAANGHYSYTPVDAFAGVGVPRDLRQVRTDFTPVYKADEEILTLNIEQDVGPLALSFVGSYQKSDLLAQTDFDWDVPSAPFSFGRTAHYPFANGFPLDQFYNGNAYGGSFGSVANYIARMQTLFPGGNIPTSALDTGAYVGSLPLYTPSLGTPSVYNTTNVPFGYDEISGRAYQYSGELRVATNRDGPLRAQGGVLYMEVTNYGQYFVGLNTLDALSIFDNDLRKQPSGFFGPNAFYSTDCFANINPGTCGQPPYYVSELYDYKLKSLSFFGEANYAVRDNLNLTFGLRYTRDKKESRQRVLQLSGVFPFETLKKTFPGWTGRVGIDWTPQLAFTDETLLYGFYSRGFKSGGFNTATSQLELVDPTLSRQFDSEKVNAFELGMKNTFADNKLRLNLAAFLYNYNGLQVSTIQRQSSVNVNVDARVWGLEAEVYYAPTSSWQFDINASYLGSKIGDQSIIDLRDPTDGHQDVMLIKDVLYGDLCVAPRGANDPSTVHGNCPRPGRVGPYFGPFVGSVVTQMYSALPIGATATTSDGIVYSGFGVPRNLKGNELQNAPNWQLKIGAQRRFDLGFAYLTLRADYFIQGESWGRIFNRDPIDKLKGWDQLNLSAALSSMKPTPWELKFWMRNVSDKDNMTGMYVADADNGLFTNVFLNEPRLYGVTLRTGF